jgi:hypothetical protein
MQNTLRFLVVLSFPFILVACSGAGDADTRLSALEQSIEAVEAESASHQSEAVAASDHSALMEIEARHRKHMQDLLTEIEDETMNLDACGFSSCCSTSLSGLQDARDALMADMQSHETATKALDSMDGLSSLETDYRGELMQVAGAMRTHHEAMASAGMCCQCEGMHQGR